MTSAHSSDQDWQADASPRLVSEIRAAIDQLNADEEYEAWGPRVSDTLGLLQQISVSATSLAHQLSDLSQVGLAAINKGSRARSCKLELKGMPFVTKPLFRADIRDVARLGLGLAHACKLAIDIVKAGHMSDLESGQGAGSSQGKESDLRAIGYADGFETVPFKNPKDKFGVRVVEALVRNDHQLMGPSSRPRNLTSFLNCVWAAAGRSNAVSWVRILRARARIAEKVRSEEERRSAIRKMREQRNAAWLEQQKLHSTDES